MGNPSLPNAGDWNRFWRANRKAKGPSWSKRRILRILQPYAVEGHAALDAGCGSGFFSRFFCDQGMATTALDYATEALAMAKELTNGRAATIRADLLDPDVPTVITQKFDLIFSDGLLEHFSPDDQNIIVFNLKKLLKESGVLITFVPNRYSPWELIRPLFMPGIKEDPFTLPQLVSLNRRNGLVVIAGGGINTFPFPLSPDAMLGPVFGMLLYSISKSNDYAKG